MPSLPVLRPTTSSTISRRSSSIEIGLWYTAVGGGDEQGVTLQNTGNMSYAVTAGAPANYVIDNQSSLKFDRDRTLVHGGWWWRRAGRDAAEHRQHVVCRHCRCSGQLRHRQSVVAQVRSRSDFGTRRLVVETSRA